MPFDVSRRPWGAVQETEQNLRDVPLPRRERSGSVLPFLPSPFTAASAKPPASDYDLDPRATNSLTTLPPDVQEQAYKALRWYEIAAHPGATDFERALAHAHYDELAPPPKQGQEQPKEKSKEE